MFSTSWKTAGIFFVRANNDTANFITKLTFSGNEIVSFQLFSHFQTRFPDYSRQRKFFMQNSKPLLAIDITIYFENF